MKVKQTLPDERLASLGHQRNMVAKVSYFVAAIEAVAGTKLIATFPRRSTLLHTKDKRLKLLSPPNIFPPFKYLMIWHPASQHGCCPYLAKAHHAKSRHIIRYKCRCEMTLPARSRRAGAGAKRKEVAGIKRHAFSPPILWRKLHSADAAHTDCTTGDAGNLVQTKFTTTPS
jgi:hypothetical protein